MSSPLPILFVKTGCPWCAEVERYLHDQGIAYEARNVTQDPAAHAAMVQISGQTKAPVLLWHGDLLADFGVAELVPFLAAHPAPVFN